MRSSSSQWAIAGMSTVKLHIAILKAAVVPVEECGGGGD